VISCGCDGRILISDFRFPEKRPENSEILQEEAEIISETKICKETQDWVLYAEMSPDKKHIICGGWDNQIRIYNFPDLSDVFVLGGHSHAVTTCTFSQNGNLFASSSYDGSVRLWDTKTGKTEKTYSGHSDRVHKVVFSENQYLISASQDHVVKIWSISKTTPTCEFFCEAPATTCAANKVGNDMVMVCGDILGNLYHTRIKAIY